MEERLPSRDEALALLKEYNQAENLIQHALAVESAMRYIARLRGEPEDVWGVIGLIHDLDYEKYPNEHCTKTAEILRARNWPEDAVRAVVSHGWGICSNEEPRTLLEKTLYTVDELTGLVAATALVRPSRSVLDMEAKSVLKKWKDKRFAAGVNREVIEKGVAMLGTELPQLVTEVIMGMREAAAAIGLAGTAPPQPEKNPGA